MLQEAFAGGFAEQQGIVGQLADVEPEFEFEDGEKILAYHGFQLGGITLDDNLCQIVVLFDQFEFFIGLCLLVPKHVQRSVIQEDQPAAEHADQAEMMQTGFVIIELDIGVAVVPITEIPDLRHGVGIDSGFLLIRPAVLRLLGNLLKEVAISMIIRIPERVKDILVILRIFFVIAEEMFIPEQQRGAPEAFFGGAVRFSHFNNLKNKNCLNKQF